MTDLVPIRRALISVSDKNDLIPFARGLVERGIEIISTGGTHRALTKAGLSPIAVETLTGFPEMMDGRVKTLHPTIHGGILARRDMASHVAAMAKHDIQPIDIVCVNLYPFEQTIRQDEATTDEAIEQIDIGGPSMVRSAAKNHDFVTVVTDPSQYVRAPTRSRDRRLRPDCRIRRDDRGLDEWDHLRTLPQRASAQFRRPAATPVRGKSPSGWRRLS
jgi:phosphoribosylaminoimidazolecarboxamide formyltransferase / IMP cyclohydrolase